MLLVTLLILSFLPQLKGTDRQEKVAGSLTCRRWRGGAAACTREHCPKLPGRSWLFYVPRVPRRAHVTMVTAADAGRVSQDSCSFVKSAASSTFLKFWCFFFVVPESLIP